MVMSDFLFFENFVLLLLVGYQTSGRHQYVKTTTPPLALPNCCPEGYFQIIWLNQCWTRTTWLVKHRLRVNVCVCVGACMPDVMFDHSYITVLFGATYLQWCAICEHMDGGDNMVIGRDMAVFNMPIQLAWTFSVMIFSKRRQNPYHCFISCWDFTPYPTLTSLCPGLWCWTLSLRCSHIGKIIWNWFRHSCITAE